VERVQVPDALTRIADEVVAPLKASAIILPMTLILATVLGQADTELIRPDTQISLEKISLPSGTLFTPLLGLKLSVFSFYALAPLIVFVLHWMLLRMHPVDDEPWAKALRNLGSVLAPLTLFALLWRFSPYAHARPEDAPGLSGGLALSYLHAAFLIADTALILYARAEAIEPGAAPLGSPAEMLRQVGLALRASIQAGLLFIVVFFIAALVAASVRSGLQSSLGHQLAGALSGTTNATAVLVAGALFGVASWPALLGLRRLRFHVPLLQSVNPDTARPRGASMSIYSVLLTALVASVALPDLGRPLNFSGARLAAAEPSDAIISAMIASPRIGPDKARDEAWRLFGRGLDYTRWQFIGASFDGATMPLITLDETDLSGASFIRADMIGSHLQGAKLVGAVLSEANLRDADLSCANVRDANNCLKLAQGQKNPPASGDNPRSSAEPAPASSATSDACTASRNGPILNKAILAGATLTRADLSNASLRSVDFTKMTHVTGTKFIGADLTEAILASVDFSDVDLSKACLCGADLSKAHLEKANLSKAVLRNADLRGATLPADLQGIDFSGANLKGAIFTGEKPNLQETNLTEATQADDFKPVCKPPAAR
jgi:uncharacterized protein YjbI with pentapeptide repeats